MNMKDTKSLVDHPGTFILEEIEAREWTQADLAYILNIVPQQLNKILNGKGSITPEFALALGDAFDMPAEFFSNLQKLHDLSHAQKPDAGVRRRAAWAAEFPVRKMIERGFIQDTDPALLDAQMLRFFGKNSIEELPFVGAGEVYQHAARKADYSDTTPSQYVWLHRVIKIAETIKAPLFDRRELLKRLPEIRRHMLSKEDIGKIPHILMSCGIRFVLVEALPNTKIDGVCIWVDGQPVIGMTTLHDRMDNFCFVLRHEIEHILNGDGKDGGFSPIDTKEGSLNNENPNIADEERLANNAAAEFLVPQGKLESFFKRKALFISERDVLAFAARIEIHPAVVIGQIQNKTKKWAWLRKYLKSIRSYLDEWDHVDGWGRVAPVDL